MLQGTLPAGFIAPCLPTKTGKLPSGGQWLHEIKHDGFRIIARKSDGRVRLYSRPGNDFTRRFPLIVEALQRLRYAPASSMAKLRSVAVAVTVAIAAPIEAVVDPHLNHLNVAVPLKESVSGEALEPKRRNKSPIVQPQKVILHLRRPIGREGPLDARAQQPAAIAVVGGGD
jgi:ATP dependent DNA ligase-like protein